jgi:hypothetical protein
VTLNAESLEQAIQAVVRLAAFDRRALQVRDRETLTLIHVTSESTTRRDAFSVLKRNFRPFAEADRFGVTFIDLIAVLARFPLRFLTFGTPQNPSEA